MLKKLVLGSLLLVGSYSVQAFVPHKVIVAKDKKETLVDIPADLERNYDDMLQLWASNKNEVLKCDYDKNAVMLVDDSVYIKRLYALPSKMELAYNNIVKQCIEMYANRRRGQVSYMLGLGNYYFPLFEEALNREGLPLELKYLPVIESALNPIARSRMGATGLWQFMPATGKMYKLEINSLVDERRDPFKSTEAAVNYLKDMYEVYDDWNLVIAAYNCGPGNVNKAIRRSGGKRDYWDIYPYLPKETRGYVPLFIAATYIMNYHHEHKICPSEVDLPILVDTLGINKLVHFEQISDMIGVDVQEIRRLNPQFMSDIIPGEYKEYSLRLPIHNLSAFIANEDTIYSHRQEELLTHQQTRNVAEGVSPASGGQATHKVRKGETLGAIAMRYRVSVGQIKRWNGMSSDRLSVGKVLKVSNYIAPVKSKTIAKNSNSKKQQEKVSTLIAEDGVLKRSTTTTKTTTSTYQVQSGDTWQGIANKTGASVANIKQWNGIRNNRLVAGHNFKIHKTETIEELAEVAKPEIELAEFSTDYLTAAVDAYIGEIELEMAPLFIESSSSSYAEETEINDGLEESNVIYHKLIYGETISQIAEKYNVSVDDILSWNNITKGTSTQVTRLLIILPEKQDPQIASLPKSRNYAHITAHL